MISLEPLGDRAFLARFATEDEARGWARGVRRSRIGGVEDVVLAYRTVGVHVDPRAIDLSSAGSLLAGIAPDRDEDHAGRLHQVPVLYDGADLAEVADRRRLSIGEVIALHAGREYMVKAVGFLPGFPYAGDLPVELAGLPRRDSPRPRVPAGSVAIAGTQTGIYPGESPGGWNLLGRTPWRIADLARGLVPIRAGDRLRFVAITEEEFRGRDGESLAC